MNESSAGHQAAQPGLDRNEPMLVVLFRFHVYDIHVLLNHKCFEVIGHTALGAFREAGSLWGSFIFLLLQWTLSKYRWQKRNEENL